MWIKGGLPDNGIREYLIRRIVYEKIHPTIIADDSVPPKLHQRRTDKNH